MNTNASTGESLASNQFQTSYTLSMFNIIYTYIIFHGNRVLLAETVSKKTWFPFQYTPNPLNSYAYDYHKL